MNADPLVMRYFPSTLTAEETDALLARNRLHFESHGFGLWAIVEKASDQFARYIGLAVPSFEAHFTPCVENRLAFGGPLLESRTGDRGLGIRFAIRVRNSAT